MNESKRRRKFHDAIGEEPMPAEIESQTRVALKPKFETSHATPRDLFSIRRLAAQERLHP
jgi:hypothetical protein